MSSQITKEELTRIKGTFQAKYGYEMDEWTAVILTELNDRFGNFSQTVQQSTNEVGNAAQLIKARYMQFTLRIICRHSHLVWANSSFLRW